MAKKRYVGWKWEDPEQTEPIFDAKGIETIRRDSCPLVAKVMEKFLTVLFGHGEFNVSEGKKYLQNVWQRMRNGYYPVSDFIFANEVKNVNKKSSSLSSLVAREALLKDPGNIPEYGDRVPYLVVIGMAKGNRLVDLVISPSEFSPDRHDIFYDYYVQKQLIPVISRCIPQDKFNILQWYNDCTRDFSCPSYSFKSASKIDAYFTHKKCLTCNSSVVPKTAGLHGITNKFCIDCSQGNEVWKSLWYKHEVEKNSQKYQKICGECCNVVSIEEIPCIETECRIYWRRKRAEWEFKMINFL